MEKAVIDRIEDGEHAVLLVGEEEVQRVVDVDQLPADAGEGTWLQVEFDDNELTHLEIDQQETDQRRHRIQRKLERLRSRGDDDD